MRVYDILENKVSLNEVLFRDLNYLRCIIFISKKEIKITRNEI